jgi:hypothetical protein
MEFYGCTSSCASYIDHRRCEVSFEISGHHVEDVPKDSATMQSRILASDVIFFATPTWSTTVTLSLCFLACKASPGKEISVEQVKDSRSHTPNIRP